MPDFDFDTRYTWDNFSGVAFYAWDWETAPDEDTEWTGIEERTGNVIVSMVGDDRRFSVDPDDLQALAEDGYCGGCGQIGCKAYAEVE